MSAKYSVGEKLCLTCGLCCNGVIFADVQLQRGDHAERFKALGLPLARLRKTDETSHWKFPQPCAAFDGCHCRIYADRPKYCRAFDCALLKSVNAGEVEVPAALRTIEKARGRAEKVKQLLRKLGDKDEHIALILRFRRAAKRFQQIKANQQTADTFGELTLANHDLNLILSENFYPGGNNT
ncbi:MAG: YkgJ family cysteine cluster protein [Verrucomicrobiota bacterium]